MVKGTSRQVIVVHAGDDKLFDQAIFLLREGAVASGGVTDEKLLQEARQYLHTPLPRRRSWLHNGPVWGAAGAAATGLAWLISMLV